MTISPMRLINSASPRWYAVLPVNSAHVQSRRGRRRPEVLQVRHETAFAQHADMLLTADVLAFDDIDHLHLTGIVLGISPVARAAALTLLDAALDAGLSVSLIPTSASISGPISRRCAP